MVIINNKTVRNIFGTMLFLLIFYVFSHSIRIYRLFFTIKSINTYNFTVNTFNYTTCFAILLLLCSNQITILIINTIFRKKNRLFIKHFIILLFSLFIYLFIYVFVLFYYYLLMIEIILYYEYLKYKNCTVKIVSLLIFLSYKISTSILFLINKAMTNSFFFCTLSFTIKSIEQ
ncbi:hypothetical protein AGLY_000831 [Aphis glycines]|uniref:Uncharacterized protein n=1 Tax=Aphis glycines TaxID=307491 RepID=A0A6G0U836_APHGL|nr:hypothetical protein AGLY_000831 [Aphis glycines]